LKQRALSSGEDRIFSKNYRYDGPISDEFSLFWLLRATPDLSLMAEAAPCFVPTLGLIGTS
jgi:hypothetical protein